MTHYETITLKELVLAPNAGGIIREMHKNGILTRRYPALAALDFQNGGHKDNFDHSIKVLENAKELARVDSVVKNNDYVLFIAALFHDVGKPATYEKINGLVTFQAHEYAGATMMNEILRNEGLTKAEVKTIKMLIANHMRSHTFAEGWSDSAIRRLANEAGTEVEIHRLGIIFASDATTKHEEKKARFRANAFELRDAMLAIAEEDILATRRPAIDGNEVMELTGLAPGRELGMIMKYLNSEEGLSLSKTEAIAHIKENF